MKIACLINTYTSARQIDKLVKKLNNGQFDFYIHVDKKLDIKTHQMLFDVPNVYFVKDRVDIKWGSITSVKATINGLKQIGSSGIQYDYINFMSGQDYPIKSADYIINFLEKNKGKQFIHYKDFEDWPGGESRLYKYFLTDLKIKGKFRLQEFLNKIIRYRRSVPKDIKIYGYATFWTLTYDCAMYFVKYWDNNPSLVNYFTYTFGSDELAYPTVIMNSPYKDDVVNDNYRYADWSEGGERPKFLKTEDFDKIITSGGIFARKFNVDIDENILDLIDNYNAEYPLL